MILGVLSATCALLFVVVCLCSAAVLTGQLVPRREQEYAHPPWLITYEQVARTLPLDVRAAIERELGTRPTTGRWVSHGLRKESR